MEPCLRNTCTADIALLHVQGVEQLGLAQPNNTETEGHACSVAVVKLFPLEC